MQPWQDTTLGDAGTEGGQGRGGPGDALRANAAANPAPAAPVVPPPVTKAPPAVTKPAPAAAPDYMAEYNAQMSQAKAGLDQQFRGGLAAINAAGAYSQGQVAAMPAQINTIYGDATALGTPGAAQTAAANKAYASGEKGAKGSLAESSAGAVAMASNKATELSSVPQLHAVVSEDVANHTATLTDAHQAAVEALDQHAADIAAAAAQGVQTHDWTVKDATTAYNRSKSLALIGSANAANTPSKLVPDMTNGDVTKMTHSAPYYQWTSYINSGNVKPEDVVSTLSGGKDNVGGGLLPANPVLLQLLTELYPTFFAGTGATAPKK